MPTVELSAGSIEYEDTGGEGPAVVMLHGLLMDGSLWSGVVSTLTGDCRCVTPTLPLGAHRLPARPGSDLSLRGVAGLVEELLEHLDLSDVTLVGNDTGGALVQLIIGRASPRVGRVVLVSCDAFDNFPPGLTGKTLFLAGRLPPSLFGLFMQQLRLRPVRRLPIAFGWLTRRGDARTRQWLKSLLRNPEVRRDTVQVLRSAGAEPGILNEAATHLAGFDRPALVVWAAGDRVMPVEGGRRLAAALPRSRFVEVQDSYTLVPLDQPDRLAELIREFVEAPQPA